MVYNTETEKKYEAMVKKIADEAKAKGESVIEAWRSNLALKELGVLMTAEADEEIPDYVGSSVFGDSWAAGCAG